MINRLKNRTIDLLSPFMSYLFLFYSQQERLNMDTALTARQEAFCRAFVGGAGSAAEAARAQASRLLHTPAVQGRIDALRGAAAATKAPSAGA
jgi:hypothetical protein